MILNIFWINFNHYIDFANEKLGRQGLAFTVGVLQNIIFHFKKYIYMVDTEALMNVAATSFISGIVYAGISLAKDYLNKRYFKLNKEEDDTTSE